MKTLAAGSNTVPIVATDFSTHPSNPVGPNVTTKNYNLTVSGGVAKTFTYDNVNAHEVWDTLPGVWYTLAGFEGAGRRDSRGFKGGCRGVETAAFSAPADAESIP